MNFKRIATVAIASIIFIGFVGAGISSAVETKNKFDFKDVQLKSRSSEIKDLTVKYDKLNLELDKASKDKNISQDQLDKLNQEKKKLEEQKRDLEAQLQAKIERKNKLAMAAAKAKRIALASKKAYAATPSNFNCASPASAKAYLYCHESGNTADKWNSVGCYGLGQDCNGIVYNRCGADYACQDKFFTEYMQRKYGTWERAKAFWLARVPINGRDVGNWW